MAADPLREALRRMDEACPCRSARLYAECDISNEPDGYGKAGARFCTCSWWTEHTEAPKPEYRIQECKHEHHAIARDVVRKAAEWGYDDLRPYLQIGFVEALDAILEGRDE